MLSYQKAAMFDLSNPEAREWTKQVIKDQLIANGVSGWMCDFGEALQLDAQLFKGDAAEFHNRYPEEWAKVNYEAVVESGLEDEIVYFMRAGYLTSPQHTSLFWLGDQLQSWDIYDGLKSAVLAATTGGFSGISLTHSDIGGYTNVDDPNIPAHFMRTKELFFRYCEFNAFAAAFRTHDGNQKLKAWQLYSDEETLDFFAHTAKIFVAWKFYRMELMRVMENHGHPLIRQIFLQYPSDPMSLAVRYQYMLGSELLVALIVDEGETKVSVYLPEGEWCNAWTDECFMGKQTYEFEVPMGKPSVFYPRGSAVGLQFVNNLKNSNLRS